MEPPTLLPSAVLIPAWPDGEDVRIVLIERAAGGVHGGQVAFPGGKPEPQDPSLLHTALREAHEEIGLDPSLVKILAALEPMDTRTTGFRVHPFLALVPKDLPLHPQASEIARIFSITVRELTDPRRRAPRPFHFPTWPAPRTFDAIALPNHLILWGLTLRILDTLLPRLHAGEWPELKGR